jgi:hypothetical protein
MSSICNAHGGGTVDKVPSVEDYTVLKEFEDVFKEI